jgi:hypothetical protein
MSARGSARYDQLALTECDEETLHKSKKPNRALRSNALFRDSSRTRTRTQSAAADGTRTRSGLV